MGKDRQSKKLLKQNRVESDRDQSLKYSGSSRLESADEARKRQR